MCSCVMSLSLSNNMEMLYITSVYISMCTVLEYLFHAFLICTPQRSFFFCPGLSLSPSLSLCCTLFARPQGWEYKSLNIAQWCRGALGCYIRSKLTDGKFEYVSVQCINNCISEHWEDGCFLNYASSANTETENLWNDRLPLIFSVVQHASESTTVYY